MNFHDLNDQVKRAGDWISLAMGGISLAQFSTLLSILLSLVSIAWFAVRFYDRFTGRPDAGS